MQANNDLTLQVVKAARALISKPENWTRGAYARNAAGIAVSVTAGTACRFCSVGALQRASLDLKENGEVEAELSLLRRGNQRPNHSRSLINVNDGGTHESVLAYFDAAIQVAEAQHVRP